VERQAVVDERDLLRVSFRRSMGYACFAEVKDRFERRVSAADLIEKENRSPGRAFTTDQMIAFERNNIAVMRASQSHRKSWPIVHRPSLPGPFLERSNSENESNER
jgi:hypothetical protein